MRNRYFSKFQFHYYGSWNILWENLKCIVCRVWVLHKEPNLLNLKGRHILEILGPDGDVNYVAADMFSRIMLQVENKWTHPHDKHLWRHPLNASFTVYLFLFVK
jgi:hypothetical protein